MNIETSNANTSQINQLNSKNVKQKRIERAQDRCSHKYEKRKNDDGSFQSAIKKDPTTEICMKCGKVWIKEISKTQTTENSEVKVYANTDEQS